MVRGKRSGGSLDRYTAAVGADEPGRRTIVWAEPEQETLLREVQDAAGLDLVAVGAPTARAAKALATAFEIDPFEELRQAARRDDADLLWLMAPASLTPDERRALGDGPLRVISSEPRPLDADVLQIDPPGVAPIEVVPCMRRSPGYRETIDARAEFGRPDAILIETGAPPAAGSLFARLYDAMDLLVDLAGDVITLDAALGGTVPGVPERLPDLRGHMTVNARLADGSCAAIVASSEAGTWFRNVRLLGPRGTLWFDDARYTWNGDGVAETGGPDERPSLAELIADEIARGHGALDAPGPDTADLLALCEAARLSARTGDGEAPRSVRQRLQHP
jgi:hypothetical protein